METQEAAKSVENSPLLKLQKKYGDPFKNACLLPERALQTFKTCLKNTEVTALHRDRLDGFRQQCSDAQTVIREDLFGITVVDEVEKRAYLQQFQSYTESVMAWLQDAFRNHKANKIEHERLKLRRDALLDQLSMMFKADNDILKDLASTSNRASRPRPAEIDLSQFSNSSSKRLLENLIRTPAGVIYSEKDFGKRQPGRLKEVLRGKGQPYGRLANCIHKQNGKIVLDEKISLIAKK